MAGFALTSFVVAERPFGRSRGHALLAEPGDDPERPVGAFGGAALVALSSPAHLLREARTPPVKAGEQPRREDPALHPPAVPLRLVPPRAALLPGARASAGAAQPSALRAAGLQAAGRHVLRPLFPQVPRVGRRSGWKERSGEESAPISPCAASFKRTRRIFYARYSKPEANSPSYVLRGAEWQ